MRFTVIGNLRAADLQRATVRFWLGYGTKLMPYFRGRLADPIDTSSGLHSEASAYGLKTQLGRDTSRTAPITAGEDLRDAVDDIWDRFGADLTALISGARTLPNSPMT